MEQAAKELVEERWEKAAAVSLGESKSRATKTSFQGCKL
jgi:hypothetical protein